MDELTKMCNCPEINSLTTWDTGIITDTGVYIPSLEVMEEKLKGFFYEIRHSGPYTISYPIREDNCWEARADTMLKALIKFYMWVNHGKEWKGGKWK